MVEVGIDIPNATVMIIEDADRFGLSQLHQFRGRVGRSDQKSYYWRHVANGDPGNGLGTRQSGLPDIAMENITNVKLIKISREEAQKLLSSDPQLNRHPLLRTVLAKFEEKIHLE